ncbi:MAG TPA: hypothetical protein VE954_05875 [Oligoflexus sp.]|uniref:hypothetical protein n=1 Tax=Oligoflexus sp. TaxID=1971216 RepID=UPI002D43720A|nr:hypothetical protein [Oligoflexus sp.]HYX32621.1 hypothetical protein [Oligoflexus sp.]
MAHSFLTFKEKIVRLRDSEIEAAMLALEGATLRSTPNDDRLQEILKAWSNESRSAPPGCVLLKLDLLQDVDRTKIVQAISEAISYIMKEYPEFISKDLLNAMMPDAGRLELYPSDIPTKPVLDCLQSLRDLLSQ